MNIIRRNTDYALRVMANLAGHYGKKPVSARILAEQEDISHQFACKILQQLHRADLVDTTMGPKGGFELRTQPSKTNLLDVVKAIQGPVTVNACQSGVNGCRRRPTCTVSERLTSLQAYIEDYLRGITLDQLSQRKTTKNLKKEEI
ncbi:MAG: RrF2 family transcriptional regulator [Planctomycetota bacterium]|jgi:Rrf2 family protein